METTSMTTTKILLNSVDLTYQGFLLRHRTGKYKYMRTALADIPQEMIDQYSITSFVSNGWAYMKVRKVMTDLKQAGKNS